MNAARLSLAVLGLAAGLCLGLFATCGSGAAPGHSVIDFWVCSQSEGWTRPSDEEQREAIWTMPRYEGIDEYSLRRELHESFFRWHGGNSELFDSLPLHGLWTADDLQVLGPCADDTPSDVLTGKLVDLYLLNYRALGIHLRGYTYDVAVEPTQQGLQRIEFRNALYDELERPFSYGVRIISWDGKELGSFHNCATGEDAMSCP